MFSAISVISVFCAYMAVLFLLARWVERQSDAGVNRADHPVVYSLSLAVYCTSWTFYGSIGAAAQSEVLFLAIYIGPTLAFALGWTLLRKLARIKNTQRITSIADFISARYGKSQHLAGLVTVLCLLGIAPYIALQLKAVMSTFDMISDARGTLSSWVGAHVGPLVVFLMVVFTCLFGVRRLDPTERHPGMIVAVALESLVKLLALVCAGVFITYGLHDGIADILHRAADAAFRESAGLAGADEFPYVTWCTYLVLSMSAVLFLPRQFHVTVVENVRQDHIRTAAWLFPLYLVLINFFILPVAMGGLLLGFPGRQADTFLLFLPVHSGVKWLSLLVFIGGFSAATSMIMISAMTLATMATNHLLLPFIARSRRLGFLRQHLLMCRWAAVALVIILGYGFERTLGESYMLVAMGIISFAAVLQFAPAMLGGLVWPQANKTGALAGLYAGFAVWFYTMLLPAFARSGWISATWVEQGPWQIGFLRCEQLFGLTALPPLTHTVFWSLLFNVGGYVLGTLLFEQKDEEKALAEQFVLAAAKPLAAAPGLPEEASIELSAKKRLFLSVLQQYYPRPRAAALLDRTVKSVHLDAKDQISILELADLYHEVERSLSGAVGAATAHMALKRAALFTAGETTALSGAYGEILARLKITPDFLKESVQYYQERELLLTQHAEQLEATIKALDNEIVQRRQAEGNLRKSEQKYRGLFESAPDGISITTPEGRILSANDAFLRTLKYPSLPALFRRSANDFYADRNRPRVLKKLQEKGGLEAYRVKFKDSSGRVFPASVSMRMVEFGGQRCIQTTVRDISKMMAMEAELQRYTENLEQMVAEKTRELQIANTELSETNLRLEQTREQLALSAHQAGMAEVAVSVLHNIGNAVNSVNVRLENLEKAAVDNEIAALNKIRDLLTADEKTDRRPAAAGDRHRKLTDYFATTIELIRKKNAILGEHLVFLQKGLAHIMEIITLQQRYAGLRGFETRVNVNELIKDAEEMLTDSIIKRGIRMEYELSNIPHMMLDKNKMIQNFINLIKNAYEAIDMAPADNEKRIKVTTEVVTVKGRDHLEVVISDTGVGLAAELKEKVFQFNFSTKDRQTGFGLHDTANYIKAQGGDIDLISPGPGKGAQVVIHIPVTGRSAE